MGSKLKIFFFALLIFIPSLFAKDYRNPFIINNIEVGYNFPINQISQEFFDAINKYSSNSDREFVFRNFPSVSFRIEIPALTNFVINFEWINLKYATKFNKNESYSFNNIWRSYSENFEFDFFPISLSFFYSPFDSDFRTLFHFQFGISYDKAKWDEYVDSDLSYDPNTGFRTISETRASPFFIFGIRDILPFDFSDSEQLLNYFFVEARFAFVYRTFDFFSKHVGTSSIEGKTTILPFSIVFTIGLNLNTRSFFLK
jgi:hypothetical protein